MKVAKGGVLRSPPRGYPRGCREFHAVQFARSFGSSPCSCGIRRDGGTSGTQRLPCCSLVSLLAHGEPESEWTGEKGANFPSSPIFFASTASFGAGCSLTLAGGPWQPNRPQLPDRVSLYWCRPAWTPAPASRPSLVGADLDLPARSFSVARFALEKPAFVSHSSAQLLSDVTCGLVAAPAINFTSRTCSSSTATLPAVQHSRAGISVLLPGSPSSTLRWHIRGFRPTTTANVKPRRLPLTILRTFAHGLTGLCLSRILDHLLQRTTRSIGSSLTVLQSTKQALYLRFAPGSPPQPPTRRPPLPAPTESMDETSGVDTEVATNLTSATGKTSYSIPEDGSPITISTQKITAAREGGHGLGHGRQKSQTSLLIEYFEAGKTGDKTRSRPSVRVKVTPSSRKSSKGTGHDAIQVTAIGKDRTPSYTRRISLGSSKNVETGGLEGTEISHSSGSNLSSYPPVEIELLNHNGSDLSNPRSSRGLQYAVNDSNVSSMPPDSMLEGSGVASKTRNEDRTHEDDDTITEAEYLKAPVRSRSRSNSRDRITQKVMEKLNQTPVKIRKSSRSRGEREIGKGGGTDQSPRERRRRSSHSRQYDDETFSGADSSVVSSRLAPSERSYRSTTSNGSQMTNNPKLLAVVEDTIKRMILPEINAIKQDQKADRKLRSLEDSRYGSSTHSYDYDGLERRVSKSSSSPNITSKPKVVLNRDGDDPGVVLSRGDSERRPKHRRSSREGSAEYQSSSRKSSGRTSRQGDGYDDEEQLHSTSGKNHHGVRDTAVAATLGAGLTSAALKHHDSQSDIHERRKKRSKSRSSRSRSASIAETEDTAYIRKEDIPPMPLASRINDSDMTRDSIMSSGTEVSPVNGSAEIHTPVHEVSRGSLADLQAPAFSRTPTRTPVSKGLGMSHGNQSIESSGSPISAKARLAGLAAAGLGEAAIAKGAEGHASHHVDADGYGGPLSPRNVASPVQSVSSLKKTFEDDDSLIPSGLRPRSAASRSSAGRLNVKSPSQTSVRSHESSPTTTRLASSRKHSHNDEEFITPLEQPDAAFMREGTSTPNGESVDDWFERQHQMNDRYRDSYGETTTNRSSYQTNPYPDDEKRFTNYTEDGDDDTAGDRDVKPVGLTPEYVNQDSFGVESNVASLMEPSMLSSSLASQNSSKQNGSYAERMAEQLRELGKDSPAMYEGSTLSQTVSSQDRWAALKAMSTNNSRDNVNGYGSPRQSPAKSLREAESAEPVMGASGLPLVEDPLPEIGHFDDTKSEISTNPSIIQGTLGGDATGKSTWPYTPEPQDSARTVRDSQSLHSGHSKGRLVAAAAGSAAALAVAHTSGRTPVEDEPAHNDAVDREATPVSANNFRDEGYGTDHHARSVGAVTPQVYGKDELAEYYRAMDAQDLGRDDPFTTNATHARHISGDSHGMASPLYDSATGQGIDRIQSKDIVALMDHLTVRDAQRNVRDTEILVTLVRSAAEMRSSFDEMKRFIAEQDRLIMQNTDRDAEQTVQKVLSGPRPQPSPARSAPRLGSQEDVQTKRKNVLRRALKGLTGGKRAEDLARVEEMLMQILDNVEDLKSNGVGRQDARSYSVDTLDSYEKLRGAPDSGYEPEGQAGTSSTLDQSGNSSTTPRAEKHQFHSGYDGRRGSATRVSTVMEGDEDELEPHENHVLNNQFENNERMLTPTQDGQRKPILTSHETPPYHAARTAAYQEDVTPRTADKQRKHKSNSSSIFGAKISRWSKTTTSSAGPDVAVLESPTISKDTRPRSAVSRSVDSRSDSQVDNYDDEDDDYALHEDDRLRSTQSLAREQGRAHSQAETRSVRSQTSRLTRTPSPLIPSEVSAKERETSAYEREHSPVQHDIDDFDDPKYQAHRNSLLLEHPQPRQGTTGRHQNTLETQAASQRYEETGTNSDVSQRTVSDFDPSTWGSSGTAALARNRFQPPEPLSPVSMTTPKAKAGQDDSPLVPQQKSSAPPAIRYDEPDEDDWEPQYSNSGFSKNHYYTSPYGSGHLLEPIEEVRYSLETDRTISPEPTVAAAQAINMRSPGRKITGPRPMGARSPGPGAQPRIIENTGTVRRKPVASSRAAPGSEDSLRSETF
nr:hypothetical protein CFP56_21157 [Quercus suber]